MASLQQLLHFYIHHITMKLKNFFLILAHSRDTFEFENLDEVY